MELFGMEDKMIESEKVRKNSNKCKRDNEDDGISLIINKLIHWKLYETQVNLP